MAEENEQLPFRQRALEYIATPKTADDLIQVTPPRAWIFLAGVGLALATLLAWLFLGNIAIYAQAKGILITADQAILYIPAIKSQQIKVGMNVKLSPVSPLGQRQFNNYIGKIISIDYFPSSPELIFEKYHNQSLVKYFLADAPVVTLTVQIPPDFEAKQSQLTPGILLNGRIIIARQTPFALMMSK